MVRGEGESTIRDDGHGKGQARRGRERQFLGTYDDGNGGQRQRGTTRTTATGGLARLTGGNMAWVGGGRGARPRQAAAGLEFHCEESLNKTHL